MFPYASIINWAMVAVGTPYTILVGGRILRFQLAKPARTKQRSRRYWKGSEADDETDNAITSSLDWLVSASFPPTSPRQARKVKV